MTSSSARSTFWDIPMLKEKRALLNECNVIKYAAYRMAAKLRLLQSTLFMENVRLGLIAGVFNRHHLHTTENEVALEYADLEAVIYDIFYAAKKENQCNIDVDLSTGIMIDFLLHIYDSKGKNNAVPVVSAKVCLAVLSSSRLQEKYQYFFHQFADHNNCISQKKFSSLLNKMTQIAEFLSESHSFGSHLIPATATSCFTNLQGTLGMTEDGFVDWLHQEPQLLVWLSTLYRLQASELVCHGVKCSFCKTYPIKGLRYHCLHCFKYDQCQSCFFTGKLSKRHKLKHPMEEHCCRISSKESTIAFFKILKNKLCRSRPMTNLNYLPVQPCETLHKIDRLGDGTTMPGFDQLSEHDRLLDNSELSTHTILNGVRLPREIQPCTELQSIICHLERDNRQLQDIDKLIMKDGVGHVEEYLQEHRALVEAQVRRLKDLKLHLLKMNPSAVPRQLVNLESTPLITATHRKGHRGQLAGPGLDDISPIMKQEDETRISMEYKKLLMTPRNLNDTSLRSIHDFQKPASPLASLSECSVGDISTWLGNRETIGSTACPNGLTTWLQDRGSSVETSHPTSEKKLKDLHEDLDQILDRLQKMLSSNFSVDDSFSGKDNAQLQKTTAEIEDLLTGLVDGVEIRKRNSGHGNILHNGVTKT